MTSATFAGSSIGALIGGIYAAGKLDLYTQWVSALQSDVVHIWIGHSAAVPC